MDSLCQVAPSVVAEQAICSFREDIQWTELLARPLGVGTGSALEAWLGRLREMGRLASFDLKMITYAIELATRRGPGHRISVNVGFEVFTSPIAREQLIAQFLKAGITARNICLEITELFPVPGRERDLSEILSLLRRLGVVIAIDDFGAGYDRTTLLLTGLIDWVKLDAKMLRSRFHTERVAGMMAYLQGLGVRVVAEGLECCDTLAWAEEKCDAAQGFFVGRPQNVPDFCRPEFPARLLGA